jgi:hypothetical protein
MEKVDVEAAKDHTEYRAVVRNHAEDFDAV